MKKLHARWGTRVQFVDVLIRQAHPGSKVPAYTDIAQKRASAADYRREEGIAWPVLVDDLPGSTHQVYGGLADPVYLIDRDGRVAYYNMWADAPALHRAIEALLGQDGRGVVREGVRRAVNVLPPLTDGWRGLRRGLPQSYIDMETAAPGGATLAWFAHRFRPLLAPVTLRDTPLPAPVRYAIIAGLAAVLLGGLWRRAR